MLVMGTGLQGSLLSCLASEIPGFHPAVHPNCVPCFYPAPSRADDEEGYREKCLPTTPNDIHLCPNPPSSLLSLSPPKTLLAGTAAPLCAPFPMCQPHPHPDPHSGVSWAPQALSHVGLGAVGWPQKRRGTLSTPAPPQELGGGRDTQGSGGAAALLCRLCPSPGLQAPVRGRALATQPLEEGMGCFCKAELGSSGQSSGAVPVPPRGSPSHHAGGSRDRGLRALAPCRR